MSSVTGDQVVDPQESARLDVVVLHARDAETAAKGGADRLLLSADPEAGHYSPEPGLVSAVVRAADLPVWVVLRTREGHFGRLATLGETFLELGARGLAYGFLDRNLEIDREGCAEMCAETGAPWMFHGFDQALESDRAWRDVIGLPGLESVISAGSTRGLVYGTDELITIVQRDPRVAALLTAGGGLTPEQVPWLARAGVRRFAIGSSARAGSSWTRGLVDVDRVRSWRMLVDDAHSRALGIPVDD